ncbi:MAG TPA: hypothetical protein VEY92_01585 [Pseudoxanthomonas sp.]|nr:hypothetical protein [Pseudoxanthomonas sp.]
MSTNQPLNPACAHFSYALKEVLDAVQHLSDHNLKPTNIRLDGRKPVIFIEPPPYISFLRGGLLMRHRVGNVVRTTRAASFHSCQVEWEIETRLQAQVATDV